MPDITDIWDLRAERLVENLDIDIGMEEESDESDSSLDTDTYEPNLNIRVCDNCECTVRCTVFDVIYREEPSRMMLCERCEGRAEKCTECGNRILRCRVFYHIDTGAALCNVCCDKYPVRCDMCLVESSLSNINDQIDGLRACNYCYSALPVCGKCGRKCVNRNYGLCEHCSETVYDFTDLIKNYNTDVCSYLRPDTGDSMLYGVELEVGVHERYRRQYLQIHKDTEKLIGKDAIMKFDRSIDFIHNWDGGDDDADEWGEHPWKGFEIVTRPMTYQNQMRFWKNFCENRHKLLRSAEIGTCGMHVHITKNALSTLQCGKLLVFMNEGKNRNLVRYIARRTENNYAQLDTKHLLDAKYNRAGHHDGLNLRPPRSPTIEFRVFKGSVRLNTIKSNLQFVNSVVKFIRQASTDNLTEDEYLNFLDRKVRSQYRELREHLLKYEGKLVYRVEDETGGDIICV